MADMQDELKAWQLIKLYGVAVDSKRWDFFDQIFSENVVADYGGPVVFNGLKNFKAGAAAAWGPFDASQHSMSNTVWRRDGKRAYTLTYGDWFIIRRGVEGGDLWQGKGWYHDEWTLSDVGWRISHRCCRIMWCDGNPRVLNADSDLSDPAIEAGDFKMYSISDAVEEGLFSFFIF